MTVTSPLIHHLERTIVIQARRETVFRFFTDESRWASWWGQGSTIDARPGGHLLIRYPGGVEARGEVVEVSPPARLVFTYGFATGRPIPPGSSRVLIDLESEGLTTRLRLRHEFDDASVRDEHIQGWRYQLSLFANVVANEVYATVPELVDAWFAAWSETDAAAREAALARIVAPAVRFHDAFSTIEGSGDLSAHVGAAHRFMPNLVMRREGGIRHCQGVVLADWTARGADGQERARGLSVFVFNSGGRVESVTGFWNKHPAR